jgi:hypothetical protein
MSFAGFLVGGFCDVVSHKNYTKVGVKRPLDVMRSSVEYNGSYEKAFYEGKCSLNREAK